MTRLQSFLRQLGRHVTVLIIPHTDLPVWRARFSLHFIFFCAAVWTAATVWAGVVLGRHIDYWVTKADNQVMRAKMLYLASEIERSRGVIENARLTDQQMRVLLGMRSRRSIIESADEGVGGPNVADRLSLTRLLSDNPANLSQPAIRKSLQALRKESQQRVAGFQEIAWYITNERSLFRASPNIWPANGRISSGFGYRFSPINADEADSGEFHAGVDIANDADTPIFATADGTVKRAGWTGGYGRMILIDHGWSFSTLYGHTSKVLVKEGELVQRGRMIGYMGTTGRSTGNHLHYEVLRHGKPVNPRPYMKKPLQEEPAL